ncbi:MAG: BLUF domain-containing protein [Paracoccaceae bacterium]
MSLVQLVFRSEKTPAFDAEAFARDERRYRERNAGLGITGFLLSEDTAFTSFMEGAEEVLFGLMEQIVSDSRHSSLTIRFEEAAQRRRFANWHYGTIHGGMPLVLGIPLGDRLAREMQSARRSGCV